MDDEVSQAAAAMGRKGGRSRSEKKRNACRQNAAKARAAREAKRLAIEDEGKQTNPSDATDNI